MNILNKEQEDVELIQPSSEGSWEATPKGSIDIPNKLMKDLEYANGNDASSLIRHYLRTEVLTAKETNQGGNARIEVCVDNVDEGM
jgi:hypothetical protein